MEPVKPQGKVELGLRLSGIVMAKNSYINRNGEEKYQIDVACPGNRQNITLGVELPEYNKLNEYDKFDQRITVLNVNGRVMFAILK